MKNLFVFFLVFFPFCCLANEHIEFAVIIPSYNNEAWVERNVTSVLEQDYGHFTIYYINDCSTDRTQELLEKCLSSSSNKEKCLSIHNVTRRGALSNVYHLVHSLDPDTVVVIVDGDDSLAHPHVLSLLAKVYEDDSVWMTYGSYLNYPSYSRGLCKEIPPKISQKNQFRSYKWVSSHLRTYYAKLFQLIKKEDLFFRGGFFPVCTDLATMFPMLEMASRGHFRFIPEILYLYNRENPINHDKLRQDLQAACNQHIRNNTPYKPLRSLF